MYRTRLYEHPQLDSFIEPYLVSVSPEEGFASDVHIWVFCPFVDRRLVRLVLPMFIPKTPCVHTCDDEGWNRDVDG